MQQTLLLHRDSPVQSGPVPGPAPGPGPGPDSGSGPGSRTGPGAGFRSRVPDPGPDYALNHVVPVAPPAPPRSSYTEVRDNKSKPNADGKCGCAQPEHTRTIRTRAPEAAAPRNGKTERQRQRVNLPRGAWA